MTLHFLGGIISGITGLASGIAGIFGGGTGTQQQAQPVVVESKTDWTPLYIIGGLIIVVLLFTAFRK